MQLLDYFEWVKIFVLMVEKIAYEKEIKDFPITNNK